MRRTGARLLLAAVAMLCTADPAGAQYALPGALGTALEDSGRAQASATVENRRSMPHVPDVVPLLPDSVPYRSRSRYVITGTLIGLSAGLTVALISRSRGDCDCFPGPTALTVGGALLGAGVGALGGLLVHAMIKAADRERAEASRPRGSPAR